MTIQPKLSLFGPLAPATLVGSVQIIDQTNLIPLYLILPIIRSNCEEARKKSYGMENRGKERSKFEVVEPL